MKYHYSIDSNVFNCNPVNNDIPSVVVQKKIPIYLKKFKYRKLVLLKKKAKFSSPVYSAKLKRIRIAKNLHATKKFSFKTVLIFSPSFKLNTIKF
jgi:hypothetical protein